MNGTNRRLPIIIAAILGAAVVALTAAVVTQRLACGGVFRDVREQRALLAKYKRELRDSKASKKNYLDCSLKLGGRWSECSWSDQAPFALAQLTSITGRRGLKMKTFQPQPMSSANSILRFPVRISLEGDLTSLASVLEDVEKTTPLLEIERLDIRKAAKASGDRLQADMTISSFVVLDPNAPVAKRRALPNVLKPAPAPAAKAASVPKSPAAAPAVKKATAPPPGQGPRRGGEPAPVTPGPTPPQAPPPGVRPADPSSIPKVNHGAPNPPTVQPTSDKPDTHGGPR